MEGKKVSTDPDRYREFNGKKGYDRDNLSIYRQSIKEYEKLTDHESVPEKERLACSCLWLALKMTQPYRNRGVDYEDLIQEANLGLIEKAVEKYDPERGQFSTYATHWIKQKAIRFTFDHGRTVRIPTLPLIHWTQIQNLWANHPEMEYDEQATREALKLSKGRYQLALRYGPRIISFDVVPESRNVEQMPLVERTACNDPNPEDQTSKQEQLQLLEDLLSQLPPRERKILEMRWGCNGYDSPRSLEKCGEAVGGITKERARQLENVAMARLRKLAGVKVENVKLKHVRGKKKPGRVVD